MVGLPRARDLPKVKCNYNRESQYHHVSVIKLSFCHSSGGPIASDVLHFLMHYARHAMPKWVACSSQGTQRSVLMTNSVVHPLHLTNHRGSHLTRWLSRTHLPSRESPSSAFFSINKGGWRCCNNENKDGAALTRAFPTLLLPDRDALIPEHRTVSLKPRYWTLLAYIWVFAYTPNSSPCLQPEKPVPDSRNLIRSSDLSLRQNACPRHYKLQYRVLGTRRLHHAVWIGLLPLQRKVLSVRSP